jgi:phosphate uptake regulator
MPTRKIQLIAGTTYSLSLPKEWVKKNNLKPKTELQIFEKNNRTLVISPHSIDEEKLNEISLNIDEYVHNIDQILFAIYYLGIETIKLFSKNSISKDAKARIRKTLTHMSGTEISYEDNNKITIHVLLDKSKVNIIQVIYRISLLIDSQITNLLGQSDIDEVRINENEIDRLYHLITKMISLALIDSNVLYSSKINNVSLIPAYFLISKRLENVGDNLNHLAEYLHEKKLCFGVNREILEFIKLELDRSVSYMLGKQTHIFEKVGSEKLEVIENMLSKMQDRIVMNYIEDAVRYIIDIEEELVNISFYNKLFSE